MGYEQPPQPSGGLAALPLIAGGIDALTPDPVFAAIEKHRVAAAAFEAATNRTIRIVDIPDDLDEACHVTSEAEWDARFEMHAAVPQTLAGLIAYVAYWHDFVKLPEGMKFGELDAIGWEAIPTIAEAMERLFKTTAG